MTETFMDRMNREIEALRGRSFDEIKTYVLYKAQEFDNLKRAYETEIQWAKAELTRLGVATEPIIKAAPNEPPATN